MRSKQVCLVQRYQNEKPFLNFNCKVSEIWGMTQKKLKVINGVESLKYKKLIIF